MSCDSTWKEANASPDWKGAGFYRVAGQAGNAIPDSSPGKCNAP